VRAIAGEAVGRLVNVEALSPEAMEEACKGHDDDVVRGMVMWLWNEVVCGMVMQRMEGVSQGPRR